MSRLFIVTRAVWEHGKLQAPKKVGALASSGDLFGYPEYSVELVSFQACGNPTQLAHGQERTFASVA